MFVESIFKTNIFWLSINILWYIGIVLLHRSPYKWPMREEPTKSVVVYEMLKRVSECQWKVTADMIWQNKW
jgi:hypothetical protein